MRGLAYRMLAIVLLGFLTVRTSNADAEERPEFASPLEPRETLEHFQLPEGLRIELVAAEPQIVDPVAMRFDEFGRLWVVEMRDYPSPLDAAVPQSRISVLTDNDGDGFYETATRFAEGLLFVTGLQPWRGGAIVTLSGEIRYLRDTDGDLKADESETWFRGFAAENPQLRANHPRFALENTVYVANGLRGGTIEDLRHPGEPISISSRDFRFDPAGTLAEAVSGVGQFGLTFDDFGNRFVCTNRNPLRHLVIEDRYLRASPWVAIADVGHDVAVAGEASRVYPLANAWTTSNLHAGQFTAACGVDIYRGDALAAYYGNAFTCEPTGSLVHREVLADHGATFASKPGEQGRDFLVSPDAWFRPVNLETGPDGALYVADMYRAVIEHPDWMPDELKQRPDLRLGDDRGRIYRIVSTAQKEAKNPTLPGNASAAKLVQLLEHDNVWQRETAARLLYEKQDKSVGPALEAVALSSNLPAARAQALWTLDGLSLLSRSLVRDELNDSDSRVARQALILSEQWLDEDEELQQVALSLNVSEDAQLRFQLALSLGAVPPEAAVGTLADIGLRDAADIWTRRAVTASSSRQPRKLLEALLVADVDWQDKSAADRRALVQEVAEVAGAACEPLPLLSFLESQSGADSALPGDVMQTALLGMAAGMAKKGVPLRAVFEQLPADQQSTRDWLAGSFKQASDVAQDADAPQSRRVAAVQLLSHAPAELAREPLRALAASTSGDEVQLLAIRTLVRMGETQTPDFLLATVPDQTPAVRRAIFDALIGDTAGVTALLAAVSTETIPLSELDPAARQRLSTHGDAMIREQAAKLLTSTTSADRQAVLDRYATIFELQADPHRGRVLFQKNCSTCHKIDGIGVDVGPDISDSRVKTAEQILGDILMPNRAIDNNFISYSALTTDGEVVAGVVTAETASSVTLRQAENRSVTILRTNLEELRSSGLSLMPEGFETAIPPQDMADLIAFIKNWRYLE